VVYTRIERARRHRQLLRRPRRPPITAALNASVLNATIKTSPMTFTVGGQQFIALAVGSKSSASDCNAGGSVTTSSGRS
jgi:hypothetical protein